MEKLDINFTKKIYHIAEIRNDLKKGDSVQKEELLHLHMLMIHIKKYYESITNEEIPTKRYSSLAISPVHIHKNKKCHKDAILALGDEIVSHINGQSPVVKVTSEMAPEKIAVEQ
jgi:hypothetical protein